ncbi:hypothetical protein [Nesterenkonia halobia]|uniref:Uncharacterized protein n=1 Tax=Nesterenkonia halobia TaxID=37922 RepID=A0ABP6RCK9_9MICC
MSADRSEDRVEDAAGAEGAERPSPRRPAAPAARRGRRGTRRVVAPATSGRPEAEEARRFHSASADGDAATSEPASGTADDGSEESAQAPRTRVARPAEGAERLSPRDRWILEERPPHW